jgi:hypothetical protein
MGKEQREKLLPTQKIHDLKRIAQALWASQQFRVV